MRIKIDLKVGVIAHEVGTGLNVYLIESGILSNFHHLTFTAKPLAECSMIVLILHYQCDGLEIID
jgi:hypothetical protein